MFGNVLAWFLVIWMLKLAGLGFSELEGFDDLFDCWLSCLVFGYWSFWF